MCFPSNTSPKLAVKLNMFSVDKCVFSSPPPFTFVISLHCFPVLLALLVANKEEQGQSPPKKRKKIAVFFVFLNNYGDRLLHSSLFKFASNVCREV